MKYQKALGDPATKSGNNKFAYKQKRGKALKPSPFFISKIKQAFYSKGSFTSILQLLSLQFIFGSK